MASAATRVMLATLLLGAALHFQPCTAGTLITVDFDAPRRGPVCVGATVGDTLKFAWNEYHNLHEMPDSASYTDCKFSAATQLAPAKPNPEGVIVELPAAADAAIGDGKSRPLAPTPQKPDWEAHKSRKPNQESKRS